MLEKGSQAPDFDLVDQDGRRHTLKALLNDGPLILYFYPADFTPGCTREACAIRDLHAEIQKVGLTVAGVSPQDAESHQRFRDKYRLPFTLLSDADKAVIRMYGVDGPLGFGVRRATFLIDPSRHIRDAVLADFRIGAHDEFVSRAIALSST